MLLARSRIVIALALCFSLAPVALGLQSADAAAKAPGSVEEKGLRAKIFEIKNRNPEALMRVLGPLASGLSGSQMTYNAEFKTITVRDFPENIAVIEEAIKRLDTPEPVRPDIEIRVQILVASNAAGADDVPAELNEVVKQLQATLKYKSYGLMAAATHRGKASRAAGITNTGVAESKLFNVATPEGSPTFYNYQFQQLSISLTASGSAVIEIGDCRFNMRLPLVTARTFGASGQQRIDYENVGFASPVSLHEGEKVVVGTTTMGDKGVIVVLSARLIK